MSRIAAVNEVEGRARTMTGHFGCWPTAQQEILLHAALDTGRSAAEAWEQWSALPEAAHPDAGSRRLFPLVYRNLRRVGVTDAGVEQLKDAYRRTWRENQVRLHGLRALLRALQPEGIDVVLLKGMSLSLRAYDDPGVRPMADVDLLVRTVDGPRALAFFKDAGWVVLNSMHPERSLRLLHAVGLGNAADQHVDLHWHLLPEACRADDDADFWAAAEPRPFGDATVWMLAPADELLHVCAHGLRWNPVPPLRWIADALTLLRSTTTPFDWDRLIRTATRHRLVAVTREALRYLRTLAPDVVVAEAVARLERIPVGAAERWEYRLRMRPNAPLGNVPTYWLSWLRLTEGQRWPQRVAGFPRYVLDWWECDDGWDLLRQVPERATRRLRATRRAARDWTGSPLNGRGDLN